MELPIKALLLSVAVSAWVLLLPPTENNDPETGFPDVIYSAPLSRWSVDRAFDSARECENYKKNQYHAYSSSASEEFKKYNEQIPINILVNIQSTYMLKYMNARCVPYDKELRR